MDDLDVLVGLKAEVIGSDRPPSHDEHPNTHVTALSAPLAGTISPTFFMHASSHAHTRSQQTDDRESPPSSAGVRFSRQNST